MHLLIAIQMKYTRMTLSRRLNIIEHSLGSFWHQKVYNMVLHIKKVPTCAECLYRLFLLYINKKVVN